MAVMNTVSSTGARAGCIPSSNRLPSAFLFAGAQWGHAKLEHVEVVTPTPVSSFQYSTTWPGSQQFS